MIPIISTLVSPHSQVGATLYVGFELNFEGKKLEKHQHERGDFHSHWSSWGSDGQRLLVRTRKYLKSHSNKTSMILIFKGAVLPGTWDPS